MKKERRSPLLDIVAGALAGAASTWVMDEVTTLLYDREPARVQKRETAARGGTTAYETAAQKGAQLVGRRVTTDQRKMIGSAIHWSLGVSAGALYGLLRNRLPVLGIGSGLAYGAAFWLVMDEAALTALGLTAPPQDFPWQTHARGLAGHLVLGAVIESPFDVMDLAVSGSSRRRAARHNGSIPW